MGCDQCWQGNSQRLVISIHASRMGCDDSCASARTSSPIFQSTHPVWDATRRGLAAEKDRRRFQSTHPVWDATVSLYGFSVVCGDFNPRIPYGMRLTMRATTARANLFQSTHPVWDATILTFPTFDCEFISIHASRMGCDKRNTARITSGIHFNPRIPYGMRPSTPTRTPPTHCNFNPRIPYGMRPLQAENTNLQTYFNPRIPYGMRRAGVGRTLPIRVISIHASRMGCDGVSDGQQDLHPNFNPRIPYGMRLTMRATTARANLFQSTHPVWDATILTFPTFDCEFISIHASRMGCD